MTTITHQLFSDMPLYTEFYDLGGNIWKKVGSGDCYNGVRYTQPDMRRLYKLVAGLQ